MATDAEADLEIPELTTEWFRTAAKPREQELRRGNKRAVFIDAAVADRFDSDEELEAALRAVLDSRGC